MPTKLQSLSVLLSGAAVAGVAALVAQCGMSIPQLIAVAGAAAVGHVAHLYQAKPGQS